MQLLRCPVTRVGDLGILRAFREPRLRWINVALGVAVFGCLFVTAFSRVDEVFPGAHAIGVLALGVGVGYIASWTIFYLAVWRPETAARDRAMLQASVAALQLAGTATGLVYALLEADGQQPRSLTRAELADLCGRLTLATPANMVGGPTMQPLPISALFPFYFDRARGFASTVERWQAVVDTEFMQLVYQVLDCPLINMLSQMLPVANPTQNITWLAPQLAAYCDQAAALRRWLSGNAGHYLLSRNYAPEALTTAEPLTD